MLASGTLPDGRARWVVCPACGGHGPVALSDPRLESHGKAWAREVQHYALQRVRPSPVVYAGLCGNILDAVELAVDSGASVLDVGELMHACASLEPLGAAGSKERVDAWLAGGVQ